MITVAFLLFLSSSVFSARVGKLPPNFEICRRSDPKFEKCLNHAVQTALPQLASGYPSLGIFPIDPLKITEIRIAQGDGPISINLKFNDLEIIGLGTTKIQHFRSDLEKLRFAAKIFIPKIKLVGTYEIDGKVLVLPIKGKGPSRLDLDNVEANITLQAVEQARDNKIFANVTEFKFDLSTTKLRMDLENLFNGDKALGDNMNRFLNDNWQEIFKELRPSIQTAFGLAFAEISNRIFTKVPLTEIFPE